MNDIIENDSLDMPAWLYFILVVLLLLIIVNKIILPLIPYYQYASILEISELKKYSDNSPVAQTIFNSTLKNNPNLTKIQAKELKLQIMKHVEPEKYKQYFDDIEMKNIALSFGPSG